MTGDPMAPPRSTERESSLVWFGELLCPPGSDLRLVLGPSRHERRVSEWLVFPLSDRPRLLSPVSGGAATAALAQFNDSMTQGARLRKLAVGMSLRAGAGALLRGQRAAIVGRPADPRLDLFGSVLPEALGEPVVAAVMLGPGLRPNAKPVLQLMRPDGHVLAYAKLGWNGLTRELIANEERALTSWAERPPTTFAVPRSLGLVTWNGLSILLVSPVAHRVLRRGKLDALPPTEAVREISEHGDVMEGAIDAAPFPDRLRGEAEGLADDRIGSVASAAIDRVLDRVGSRSVRWGTAHGDWGPWNMSRTRDALLVWDWERTANPVPVGFDVLHFCFQTVALRSRGPVQLAVSKAMAAAESQLVELDVEPVVQVSLMELYLTEVLLRLAAGRASGVPVREALLTGLLELLASDGLA
jgi:hypothetical protein